MEATLISLDSDARNAFKTRDAGDFVKDRLKHGGFLLRLTHNGEKSYYCLLKRDLEFHIEEAAGRFPRTLETAQAIIQIMAKKLGCKYVVFNCDRTACKKFALKYGCKHFKENYYYKRVC